MPYAQTSRGKFYVEDWGGHGPVVCLLHGLTSQHTDWNEIAPRLVKEGFQVIAPDMRGHGKSEKPETGYSPEDLAIDTTALLQTLGMAQAHVVGHSTGGRNGLVFAQLFPARTLSLTIIDQTLTPAPERWKDAQKDFAEYPTPFQNEAILDEFLKMRYPDRPKMVAFEKGQFEKKENGTLDWIFSIPGVLETQRLGRAKELSGLLPQVQSPILFMKGAESNYVSPEEAEKIQKLIPKGRFVTVEKARHAVFRDNPEVFLQVLLEFLGRKGAKKIHPTQSQ